jgi:putative ABC transport system substrate-binding protein
MNQRRKLIFALGASALTAPFTGFAQQHRKVWRVGILWELEQSYYAPRIDAFKQGMRELGYAEGQDYVIEQRSAQNDLARLPTVAAELLAANVDLIISSGTPSAVAARNATREIPILITVVGDPIGSGFAASLRRPGGNITGLTNISTDLYTKRLDLLHQTLPGMRRVGFLYNPDNGNDALSLGPFESDCGKLGFKTIRAPVRKVEDIATAFKTLQRDKAQGMIVSAASPNAVWRESIIGQAAKHRLPSIYPISSFADSGGLISYSANYDDQYRRVAAYADKLFKGAKPGDLPIEQPIKFETVINLKTAKALGIKIPDTVMLRADKVIQ